MPGAAAVIKYEIKDQLGCDGNSHFYCLCHTLRCIAGDRDEPARFRREHRTQCRFRMGDDRPGAVRGLLFFVPWFYKAPS